MDSPPEILWGSQTFSKVNLESQLDPCDRIAAAVGSVYLVFVDGLPERYLLPLKEPEEVQQSRGGIESQQLSGTIHRDPTLHTTNDVSLILTPCLSARLRRI